MSRQNTADTAGTKPKRDSEQQQLTSTCANREPKGFFHGHTWNYGVMLVASIVGLFTSFILAAETLKLARTPDKPLSCDVNSVLSCSDVAKSWQAEIIRFGDLRFPNAFFGIAVYSVFITVAVVGLCGVKLPRWFSICAWFGGLFAFCFSYWLAGQSMFVIKALCPWCMAMMFATTIMFMALSHATVTVQGIPRNRNVLSLYYRMRYDWMADTVWILGVITIIFVKEGTAIFA